MPGCPDDERWVELIEGRLQETERSQLEAHLDGCERCSEIVALAVGATGSAPHTMGQPGIPRAIGRYPILRVLGRGAMGVVFEGTDPALQRRVAIKLLQPRFIEAASEGDGTIAASDAPHAVARSRGAEMRLLREARSLARFNHPGIVEIYEVGIGAEGPFIVMEVVPGTTLRIWCDAERRWFEIVRMFVQAARALAAAHEAGIVHRDFKPDNAIVADDGRLKVLDFGLARAAEPTANEHATTRAGVIVGTPVYLAPECLTGRPADARSDQFSFFVSLYEALVGHRPFQARNVQGLAAQTRAGPSPALLGELVVPSWLRAAIARGLSPTPAERFVDMHAVVSVLERGARRSGRRGRWIAASIGSTLLLGGVVWAATGEAPCTGGRDRIAPAWSAAKRDEVAHAFATAEAAWAEPLGPRVLADLDAYAGAWVDAHAQACRAADDLDRRMRCLARGLDALRAASDLLASGDADALEHAPELTSALPPIDACADPGALDTEAVDAGIELQRGRLAKADVVRLAGDFAEAERIAASVLASEDASRSDRLRAEALVVHGKALFDAAELEEAATAFESAFFLAERIDASGVALDAASHNALVLSWYLRQPGRGEAWLRHASAAARRIDLSPQQCYELEARTALVHDAATRNEDALVHHRAALRCLEGVDNDPARARTRMNMGMTLAALGRADEGLAELRAALDLFARTFGDAHPETLGARVNLGSHLSNVGQLDEALRLFADTRERISGAPSVAPALELAVYINSGVAASRAGRHEEAVERLHEAVAFAVRVHGAEHSETFEPRLNYGVALEDAGRFEEALAVQRALRADMDASPEHPPTLVPVLDLNEAVLLRKLGRLDEALELAHDARLAWTEAHDTEDVRDAWLEIARILSAMGREREAEAVLQSVQLTDAEK